MPLWCQQTWMYLSYFGLTEKPFNITPDPRFLYMSEQHRDALAHLLFSTDESSSFIVLTGEVGTGKTTLCRSMLEEGVSGNHFALILNPMQSPLELLASACDEFGIAYPDNPGIKDLVDALNRWLLALNAANEQAILIIDEAQNLSFETLEQIRLLTNLETGTKKLLKIILIGQPELRDMLDRPELRQLSQRVTARFHLGPMGADDTAAYLQHRLKVAGARRPLFVPAAIKQIQRLSQGIPRRINLIADRALTGAYARQRDRIDARLIKQANAELSHGATSTPWPYSRKAIAIGTVLLLLPLLIWLATGQQSPTRASTDKVTQDAPATLPTAVAGDSADYLTALQAALDDEATTAAADENLVTLPSPSPIATLFSLWGIAYDPNSNVAACEQAASQGLQCLYVAGSMEDFLQYNRPALIETDGDGHATVQRLIRSMDADGLIVSGPEASEQLTVDQLASIWPGKFLLLWQAPPSGKHLIHPGSPPPDTRWLRRRLGLAGIGATGSLDESAAEPALAAMIRAFQRRHGLSVDGIAGIRTLLTLEQVTAEPAVPTLRQP